MQHKITYVALSLCSSCNKGITVKIGGATMLAGFRRYLIESGKAENTVKSYCLAVKGFCFGTKGFAGSSQSQLSRQDALSYVTYLRTIRELSNRSVNTKLAALQALNEFRDRNRLPKLSWF